MPAYFLQHKNRYQATTLDWHNVHYWRTGTHKGMGQTTPAANIAYLSPSGVAYTPSTPSAIPTAKPAAPASAPPDSTFSWIVGGLLLYAAMRSFGKENMIGR
jgi:hypothetical protein